MALVNLIQKLDTAARDAVVQVEDWNLPAEAKLVEGKVDDMGRAFFTVVKTEEVKIEAEVKAEVAKVEPKAKSFIKKVEDEVKKVVTEVEDEAKKLLNEAEGVFKANT